MDEFVLKKDMLTAPDHIREYCVCSEVTDLLHDFFTPRCCNLFSI